MKYILRELEVGEVSLVDKAANKRKFLLIKSKKGGNEMPMTEVILNCDVGREELIKSIAEMSDDDVALLQKFLQADDLQGIAKAMDEGLEEIKKAGISDKAMKAVKMALAALKGVKDELPKDILAKLSALGGYAYPQKMQDSCAIGGKDQMKKSFGDYTIVKNEDGTVDFSDIPEEMQPLAKAMWKEQEVAVAKAAEAEKIAKAERDERIKKDFIAKAADTYKNLPAKSDELGLLLKSVNEAVSEEQYAEVERLLKAADEAIEQSVLLKTAGRDGEGSDDGSAYAKLEKAANKILAEERGKFGTFEQAYEEAELRNPKLVSEVRAEG